MDGETPAYGARMGVEEVARGGRKERRMDVSEMEGMLVQSSGL